MRLETLIKRNIVGCILLAGLVAVFLSSYPIVFFDKSYVSPGYGPPLLYDNLPFVPGYSSTERETISGDHGAMPWAFLPYSRVQHESVFEYREFPFWNRYNSAGIPLYGQGQSAIFDPLHWIVVAGEGNGWAWDLKFLLSKLIFCLGVGSCLWLMTRCMSTVVVVTVSSAFIGLFSFKFNHPDLFNLTYSPWIFFSYLLLIKDPLRKSRSINPWRHAHLLGIVMSSCLHLYSSTPKNGILILVFMHLAGVIGILGVVSTVREMIKSIISLVCVVLVILLITAPHWLVFLDTLSRGFSVYDEPNCNFSTNLFPFVDSFFLGHSESPPAYPSVNLFIFFFAAVALLSVVYFWRNVFFWMSVVPLTSAVAVALGVVPNSVCRQIPLLGNMHGIWQHFFLTATWFAILVAGLGYRWVLSSIHPRSNNSSLVCIKLVLVGLAFFWAILRSGNFGFGALSNETALVLVVSIVTLLLFAAFLVWLSWMYKGRINNAGKSFLAVLFLITHAGHGFHLPSGTRFDKVLVNPTPRADFLVSSETVESIGYLAGLSAGDVSELSESAIQLAQRRGGNTDLIEEYENVARQAINESPDILIARRHAVNFLRGVGAERDYDAPARVIAEGRTPMSGFNAFMKLEGLNGPDALMNARYMELLDHMGWRMRRGEAWFREVRSDDLASLSPLLDLLNVGYLVSWKRNLSKRYLTTNPIVYGELDQIETTGGPLIKPVLTRQVKVIHDKVKCEILGLKTDGQPDNVFTLDLSNQGLGSTVITNLTLRRSNPPGIYHTEDTAYLMGVAANPNSQLLNKEDGQIEIAVNQKNLRLWLFACADGLDNSASLYQLVITLNGAEFSAPAFKADMMVWARKSAWPRAFFVDDTAVYDNPTRLANFINDSEGQPLAAVQGMVPSIPDPERKVKPAVDYQITPNSTSFTVEANGPGMVVLSEANFPGDVHVRVNGENRSVVTVNHAFRGVELLQAGLYDITFFSRPRLWYQSLSLFGAGLFLLGVTVVYGNRRRVPEPE